MAARDSGRKHRAARIGANIKKYRLLRKLTPSQVTRRCGWPDQTKLWRYENGRCEPKNEALETLGRVLRVSIDRLLKQAA